MNVLELKEMWYSVVGGPELLFALRIASTVPLLILAMLKAYEFVSPLHRHPLTPPRDSLQWRIIALLIAASALGIAGYLLVSGMLDRGVTDTTFNKAFANVFIAPLAWLLCLSSVKHRKDSWSRKYLGTVGEKVMA
jgi:hypothetical protein